MHGPCSMGQLSFVSADQIIPKLSGNPFYVKLYNYNNNYIIAI